MSDDLKPCPFCGVGVRAMSRYHPRDPNEWYVSCAARGCVMQPETPTYRTEAEATEAWNRRAPDAEIERLRAALRDLINIPAVRQVLGARHTADCGCPLCRSRAALSPLPAKKGGTVD